jgi:hypothetical protein
MAGLKEFYCGWNEPSHASQFKWLEYTFNPGFFASYWSLGFGTFLQYRPLLPIGWTILQILCQRRRIRPIQRQPFLVQYKHQAKSTFINEQLQYTLLVVSRNDKK